MRDDGLWLDADDALLFAGALKLLDWALKKRGHNTPPDIAAAQRKLEEFIASRVESRVDATTRPMADWMANAQLMDSTEAAERLGLTPGAVRKACRSGRLQGVARKELGRWMIPAADVEMGA
ncbi:helix-turn-helix domain-containing protein [Mycolicibacterium sp. lyk4-40-TYG-92]|uniref:helix-turn-helix domain-containing protein n=1 Tax=Mycolicibacterium sp. lyk4-40-TYG-92 TaxID=3040295 RepID=UPI00254DCD86|nr:helix-turn-helix domain-containing protein [Mycolicibacterium sp. lyk4-40-TYG-92]